MAKKWIPCFGLLILIVAYLLSGCGKDLEFQGGDSLFQGGVSSPEPSQTSQTEDTVEEEEIEVPENNSGGQESMPEENETDAEEEIIITVSNKNVMINGQPLEYDQRDLNALRDTMNEFLSNINDGIQIHVDFENGDDDVVTVIENEISRSGLSMLVIEDSQ